jgi:adenylyltransferase/sulfurtransferase
MTYPSLTERELDYYSRQIVLNNIGLSGQRKLKDSKVCVVGAGGLGSPILIQLTSMGVGYIRVIDRDIVDISNLQRQPLYGMNVLGVPKVEAAKDRLNLVNPFVEVDPVPMPITPSNAIKQIQGVDVVVDALDAMAPRYALNRACQKLGIPFIHGGVIMQNGTTSTIIPGETACLECFQGGFRDEELPSCAVQGVHPSVISIIGSIQVSETIKIILGEKPVLKNTLLFVDISDLSFEKIQLSKLESCPICGSDKSENVHFRPWQEVCGREAGRTFVYNPDIHQEIDLEKVEKNAVKKGYKIFVKSELGLTFKESNIRGSILVSGVSIFEGLRVLEDAKTIRKELLN